jgi:hypothetical protein
MNYARMNSSTKQAFANERYYAVECHTPRRNLTPRILFLAFAALVGLFLAQAVSAQERDDSWQTHQYAIAASAIVLHAVDWRQTRHIATSNEPGYNGPRYVEKAALTKRVIGETPSHGGVDAYMLATGVLFLGAAHLLPEYRTAILATWAATRLAVVVNNHSVGLRIGGSF